MNRYVLDVETCERLSTAKYGPAPEGKPHALRPTMATVALVTVKTPLRPERFFTVINAEAFGIEILGPDLFHDTDGRVLWLASNEAALFGYLAGVVFLDHAPIVTFNGRRFDIPVLAIGFARHGLKIPPMIQQAFKESRYNPKLNLDVFDRLSGFGATSASLSEYCRAFGLEDPKAAVSGAAFESLCNPNGVSVAIEYNQGDVVATEKLFDRWAASCAK